MDTGYTISIKRAVQFSFTAADTAPNLEEKEGLY